VLAGGVAVVGDPGLYATAGDTRVADVAVDGADVVVTVLGAGEAVDLTGWSSAPIAARAWSPASGAADLAVAHDAARGSWRLTVAVGEAGWATVRIRHLPDAPMGVLGRT